MPVNKLPQAISDKTWEAIKAACVSGMGFSAAARAFGINNVHTLIMRARRDHWPIRSRVKERARQLQTSLQRRSEAAAQRRDADDVTTGTLAQDWVSRSETHRALIYELTNAALRKVSKQPAPLEDWGDIERADKAGRRACRLDDSEAARHVNVGLQMVNQRIAAYSLILPKDGADNAPELPNSELTNSSQPGNRCNHLVPAGE